MAFKIENKSYCKIAFNEGGATLGYQDIPLIEQDGYVFKDLARSGELLPFEDWRLSPGERAQDLAARLSIEEIAGLMLYSPHQMVPSLPGMPFQATYDGKPFIESGKEDHELSDQLKEFLVEEHIRHILALQYKDAVVAAKWNNEMQSFVEGLPFGIPVNTSSDPRHGAESATAEFKSSGADVSKWPEGMGMSALFDPDMVQEFAKIAAKEYRALGITTALGPQIDLATEPRWMRYKDTFGGSTNLTIDYVKAYVDGMQTTENSIDGWGSDSVNTMVKHWPGGGTGEGGRDAHYAFGAYAVYPGDAFTNHLRPFTEGAFQLDGPTKRAASVMPYYTISNHIDQKNHENVGNAYSEYIIHDLLRTKYKYSGVVCTDWGITADPAPNMDHFFGGRCYGENGLTEARRHLKIIENGVDQFGGNSSIEPILKAYEFGCEKYGKKLMRKRLELSAERLLINMFQVGLFENPYVDPMESKRIVGCKEYVDAGYEAQLRSVVLLKNKDHVLPIKDKVKVYVPERTIKAKKNFFRMMDEPQTIKPVDDQVLSRYFIVTSNPEDADVGIVFLDSPMTDPYNEEEGYLPISLQYRPYTAKKARTVSLAGGDFREKSKNRSYQGKTVYAANESDLDNILMVREKMQGKPVIAVINLNNPAVVAEFEPYVDGMLAEFGVEKRAVLDIITGRVTPSGLLPCRLPKDMETVEVHKEDIAADIKAYVDTEGHPYDFSYGMNFDGVICDDRSKKYQLD
ncbi:beta-glucosidase [Lachnospiraceae bacterium KM106-2]|nr:beta-glucosidase [Lachnospiraceae bacterium KM106-2]